MNVLSQSALQADSQGGLEFVWRPAEAEYGPAVDMITHDLNVYRLTLLQLIKAATHHRISLMQYVVV